MDNYHMGKILKDIQDKTYIGKDIPPFKIEIFAQEQKTFHGDYNPNTGKIRIFNMSRPADHIISTTIHELAHHVDFSLNGNVRHNKQFYGVMRELMKTAVKCGYIDYDVARKKCDSNDITMMEKYYGPITCSYDESYDTYKDIRIVRAANAFNIKEWLKAEGFHYNNIEKLWEKDVKESLAESLIERIKEQDSNAKATSVKFNEIPVEAHYYVLAVGDTYSHKDELSANGYRYKGYFINENAWVKKIPTTMLNSEKRLLASLGLSCKIKNGIR